MIRNARARPPLVRFRTSCGHEDAAIPQPVVRAKPRVQ
jgi:hypothetical protein